VIENARVLTEGFVPREVSHRNAELNALSTALEPASHGDPAEHVLLFGPTGTGKTCLARYTLRRLEKQALDVATAHANCWESHSRFRALYQTLDALGSTVDVHRRSTPADDLLDRIRDAVDAPTIVVLDEIDQLDDSRAIYDLYRVPEIALVGIANREPELMARLDDRVVSRLQGVPRVTFERYGVAELSDILRDRADEGLSRGAVSDAQLERIADVAAGDARVALAILRSAAQEASDRGRGQLTDAIIDEAVPEGRDDVRQATLEKLTDHQRVLYDVLQDTGDWMPAGELYDRYRERVDEPKSERMLRNYLSKMEHYNLVEEEGATRWRRYRAR
jgi:orc1/cdc6 family replication initiation protein